MARYFYSDFHFGHKLMLKVERNHFSTIEEHDDFILKSMKKLQSTDELYFLGDFGYLDDEKAEIFKSIPCRKFMIMGNHDKFSAERYKNRYGFTEVYPGAFFIAKRVVLSHFPIQVDEGVINIHGHLHNSVINLPNYINANVHMLGYELLGEKQINNLLGRLKYKEPKFLEEWYAHLYRFNHSRDDLILDRDGVVKLEETLEYRRKLKEENMLQQTTTFED